ncbi:uncharacterized protein FIESC28_02271 [Fusarium coffeatum]|uniref:Extradiol ring-cleavage dioxygenase class III enzyme subunit B domain-containing protein n=1 Tax=Fusarium coffeatum TaxID=231269 RepID=A0A366S6Q2_9HYPO|nr:uncharacterized protein FIESC28_02271 [Fusarium coffeatum]RBR25001.1 hypothetical protein FIESC28_02271 [Fusarium coffeatum]
MATRPAEKAGHWYKAKPTVLKNELQKYLAAVPDTVDGAPVPISGARVVIAPHAGYDYSGPCAAWAYKTLDLTGAKRVFVLGPSHTYYLEGCATSTFGKYETPFGDLTVDQDVVQQIKDAAEMEEMPTRGEVSEHSLEMHMPYLYLRCEQTFGTPDKFPKIVPLLIGNNSGPEEKAHGKVLLPYLQDPENAFVVSSDFCHWGKNFSYQVYSPTNKPSDLKKLRSTDAAPKGPPIHETIRVIDEAAMDAVKSGVHDSFLATLKETRNTDKEKGYFSVIKYDRSNLVEEPQDMSVSYVSAYAVL